MLAIIFVVVVGIGVFVSQSEREARIQQSAQSLVERAISKFPSFKGKPAILGDALVLIIDSEREVTLVATGDGRAKEIPFSSFLGIEILEDGHSIAETRRKGTLGRTAVGGLLGGGVGAVIGAVSAGSVTKQKEIISNITISIATCDTSFPQLAWCTFAPQFGLEHMNAMEVELQRKLARQFAQQFAPIFESPKNRDEMIVEI